MYIHTLTVRDKSKTHTNTLESNISREGGRYKERSVETERTKHSRYNTKGDTDNFKTQPHTHLHIHLHIHTLSHLGELSMDIREVLREKEKERASSSLYQVQQSLHLEVCPADHHTLATQRTGSGSLGLHVHHHTPGPCSQCVCVCVLAYKQIVVKVAG